MDKVKLVHSYCNTNSMCFLSVTVRKTEYDEPETPGDVFIGVDVLMRILYASVEIEYRFEVCHGLYQDTSWKK